jgi:hypothetical protein
MQDIVVNPGEGRQRKTGLSPLQKRKAVVKYPD